MASNNEVKLVDVAYVGNGFGGRTLSDWHKIRFVLQGFAGMKQKRGECVKCPVMECHGYEWRVVVYPRGSTKSVEDTEHVSIFLRCESSCDANIAANFTIRVPSASHSVSKSGDRAEIRSQGFKNFARRADLLDPSKGFLVNGDLTVEVDIQVALDQTPAWSLSKTVSTDMLKLLESSENSDVIFEIGKGTTTKKQQRQQGKQQFYAHRVILSTRCPVLAALAEDYENNTPIPIDGVDVDTFQRLLRFVYGDELPEYDTLRDTLRDKTRNLIRAADRFGCTGLKLAAEALLASAGITTDNAIDLILFADGTNCAMLKEAAIDYFIANTEDVRGSEGYAKLKESPDIMAELMDAALVGSRKRPVAPTGPDDRDYKRMRVSTLRRRLDSKGLDVDGSKEILISRLEEAEATNDDHNGS